MPTKKSNIITLCCTKEDMERSRRRMADLDEENDDTITKYVKKNTKKKIFKNTDDEISEKEEDKPKAMIQKMVGNETKVATPGDGIISKMFTYEEADILVIFEKNEETKNKEAWYKGKDVAKILEYVNTKDALINHVTEKYKKQYQHIRVAESSPLKMHPQTVFINNSGLFQLISRSKKPEAVKLWEFVTEQVLPELFTKGTYSLPAKESDVERLKKSFYDDNMLSDYENKPAIYLAYIGEFEGKHILKFGKTNDPVERDLQHRKTYKEFNVLKIWETIANDYVETKIKTNFESKNMSTSMTNKKLGIKNKDKTKEEKTKRELVILNEINGLDYCLNMIENVVKTTKLPQEIELNNKINEWEHKYELLEVKYNSDKQLIEQLRSETKNLNNTIADLRTINTDLRNIISDSQSTIKLLKQRITKLIK